MNTSDHCHVCCCRTDKTARELDLQWLFTSDSSPQPPSSDLSPQALTTTPYAHLVSSLLLAGPSKAVRTLSGTLLKSLWLLESIKALNSKPAASASAQRAQHVMLGLLLHWAPGLAAYPESAQPYFQLLTWIFNTTPTLPEHLKLEAGSAKKKAGGKPSAKGGTVQDKPKGSSSSSSSSSSNSGLTMRDKAEGVFQTVVTASAVLDIFAAIKRYNAVLANHIHGVVYQSLQVSGFSGWYVKAVHFFRSALGSHALSRECCEQ